MRVPRITGFPSMTVGLISIRSCTETWMPLRCAELLPTVSSEAGRRPLLGGHSSQVAVADTAMISRSSDDRSGDMTVIWQPALSEEAERCAGSDAAAIEATAVREGDGWRLRGEKHWIGNGGASRYYVAFAKTDPGAGGRGISAFVVDKEASGVVIDELCDKMGIRGTQTSNLRLDVMVPDTARVGEVNRALPLAFATLNVGRVMVAAQSLGLALAAYREATRRAVERRAFGQAIIENQAIGFKLADMAVEVSAARMMLYEAAKAYDDGRDVATL